MKPRAPMRVLVVAVERPPSEYLEFHRELGAGAMEVLDCHSDPHGWASPDPATGEPGIVHGDGGRDGAPARPLCCRLDPTDGFAALVAGARKLAGGERALLVIDSVNPLLAEGGLPATARALRALSSQVGPLMFVVHKDLAEARAAADLAHLAETLVVVAGDAHALGADAPPGGCSVCSMRVVRRRDVGTVSTRHGVLQWSAYEAGAGGYRFVEVATADALLAPEPDDADAPALGVSFNLELSEAERKQRAAVALPFQRHLAPGQDRGTTSGDLEDAIQVLEDEDEAGEEAALEDDEDDPDADLDI